MYILHYINFYTDITCMEASAYVKNCDNLYERRTLVAVLYLVN
jgi:hypothetical protein